MRLKILILIAVAIPLMATGRISLQPPITEHISPPNLLTPPDTLTEMITSSEPEQPETDTVSRSRLSKLIRRTLFVGGGKRQKHNAQVVDEAEVLERFNGKQIRSITFDRHDVFEDKRTWFRSLANGMHMRTVESALGRDLLFRVGDEFDSETAVSSNRIITDRPYISDSWLDIKLNPDDTTQVDITLVTYDNWTIGLSAGGRSEHRAYIYLYDYNFLGMGNRVGTQTHFRYANPKYLGNVFDYENLNFLSTFYTAAVKLGHDFENTYTDFAISKNFILPSDYEVGVSYHDDKFARFAVVAPDTLERIPIHIRAANVWGGWSHFIESRQASIYATVHALAERFPRRPAETAAKINPLFHERTEVLFGTGLYWERFYTTTMIYGYGFQEYVASGQRLQLVGGYSWQEFGDYWYAGILSAKGGFTRLGYIRGEASIGSYINAKTGRFWQSALNFRGGWFSNLLDAGRSKMRFFLNVSYTQGWNRGEGAGSLVRFNREIQPTSFKKYAAGSNRSLIGAQAVIFTPYKPLGFNIALFGFADAGWIGNDCNTFHNDFYSTFGVGVRIKNERLVFGALQFRLGFAVGRNGLIRNNMFNFSTEQRMNSYRFIPTRPEIVHFE